MSPKVIISYLKSRKHSDAQHNASSFCDSIVTRDRVLSSIE